MSNVYDRGELVRCTGTFTTADGTPEDPGTVMFKVRRPSGNTTTYTYPDDTELVKDSIGVYHVDVDCDDEGTFPYRFEGTGTGQAAGEGSFVVRDSEFY